MPSTATAELGPGLRRPPAAPTKKAAAKKAAGAKKAAAAPKLTKAEQEAAAAAAFEARRRERQDAADAGLRRPAMKAASNPGEGDSAALDDPPAAPPEPEEPEAPPAPVRVSREEERRLLNRGMDMTRKAARKREEATVFIQRRTQVYIRLRDGGVPIDVIADTWDISRQALEKAARDAG